MRFYVTATKQNRKRPYQLTVGADSVADIPRAVGPGFTITEVRDRDKNVVQDWRQQIAGGAAPAVETKPQETAPRALRERKPETPAGK